MDRYLLGKLNLVDTGGGEKGRKGEAWHIMDLLWQMSL